MSGSLLQSLGLQPILDMREREAMALGDAYRQKYAQEFQEEENKRARRAGLFTTILTGAASIIGGSPALGAAIGKGLSGVANYVTNPEKQSNSIQRNSIQFEPTSSNYIFPSNFNNQSQQSGTTSLPYRPNYDSGFNSLLLLNSPNQKPSKQINWKDY